MQAPARNTVDQAKMIDRLIADGYDFPRDLDMSQFANDEIEQSMRDAFVSEPILKASRTPATWLTTKDMQANLDNYFLPGLAGYKVGQDDVCAKEGPDNYLPKTAIALMYGIIRTGAVLKAEMIPLLLQIIFTALITKSEVDGKKVYMKDPLSKLRTLVEGGAKCKQAEADYVEKSEQEWDNLTKSVAWDMQTSEGLTKLYNHFFQSMDVKEVEEIYRSLKTAKIDANWLTILTGFNYFLRLFSKQVSTLIDGYDRKEVVSLFQWCHSQQLTLGDNADKGLLALKGLIAPFAPAFVIISAATTMESAVNKDYVRRFYGLRCQYYGMQSVACMFEVVDRGGSLWAVLAGCDEEEAFRNRAMATFLITAVGDPSAWASTGSTANLAKSDAPQLDEFEIALSQVCRLIHTRYMSWTSYFQQKNFGSYMVGARCAASGATSAPPDMNTNEFLHGFYVYIVAQHLAARGKSGKKQSKIRTFVDTLISNRTSTPGFSIPVPSTQVIRPQVGFGPGTHANAIPIGGGSSVVAGGSSPVKVKVGLDATGTGLGADGYMYRNGVVVPPAGVNAVQFFAKHYKDKQAEKTRAKLADVAAKYKTSSVNVFGLGGGTSSAAFSPAGPAKSSRKNPNA